MAPINLGMTPRQEQRQDQSGERDKRDDDEEAFQTNDFRIQTNGFVQFFSRKGAKKKKRRRSSDIIVDHPLQAFFEGFSSKIHQQAKRHVC